MFFLRSIGKQRNYHCYFKTRFQSLNKDIKINLLFFLFCFSKMQEEQLKDKRFFYFIFQPASGYVEKVPQRDRGTLTGVLNRKLVANSIINSDEWRGYLNLPQFVPACIQHNTVKNTFNFVDPEADAHTQMSIHFFILAVYLLFTTTDYH